VDTKQRQRPFDETQQTNHGEKVEKKENTLRRSKGTRQHTEEKLSMKKRKDMPVRGNKISGGQHAERAVNPRWYC